MKLSTFQQARYVSKTLWGVGWENLGMQQQRGEIARQILIILWSQDDELVSDARIREMLNEAFNELCDWQDANAYVAK